MIQWRLSKENWWQHSFSPWHGHSRFDAGGQLGLTDT
jgi:hypothetical protein